jgi:hypothetical protein
MEGQHWVADSKHQTALQKPLHQSSHNPDEPPQQTEKRMASIQPIPDSHTNTSQAQHTSQQAA